MSSRHRFDPQKFFSSGAGIRGSQIQGQEVSKHTKAAGKRIGGALRAEQARQQKRRDAKRSGGPQR